MAATWTVAYLSARHFLTSFEEPNSALISHVWAYFSASLAFVLGHWLLFYGTIAQIIVLLTTLGYTMAALYYLDVTEKLSASLKKQLLLAVFMVFIIVIVLSDWTGSTV